MLEQVLVLAVPVPPLLGLLAQRRVLRLQLPARARSLEVLVVPRVLSALSIVVLVVRVPVRDVGSEDSEALAVVQLGENDSVRVPQFGPEAVDSALQLRVTLVPDLEASLSAPLVRHLRLLPLVRLNRLANQLDVLADLGEHAVQEAGHDVSRAVLLARLLVQRLLVDQRRGGRHLA